MSTRSLVRRAMLVAAAGAGVAAAGYATYVAISWSRYGHVTRPDTRTQDERLDRFIPLYDVVERHQIGVNAPAAITLAAAREQDLLRLPLVRAIFKAREIVLGATPDNATAPQGLAEAAQALGWGILEETPDRELVFGAVTKPWEANVTFHALPPEQFAAFSQPGFVKIVWTLRADPVSTEVSIFRTETRAIATDAAARARFRRYWAFASPGIVLIRHLSLRPLKRDAERRADASLAVLRKSANR